MEKIKAIIENNSQRIASKLPRSVNSSLHVSLSGRPDLKFSQEDLHAVFSAFGSVNSIQLRDDHAIVNFESTPSAFMAQRCLNNQFFPNLNSSLSVTFRRQSQWSLKKTQV